MNICIDGGHGGSDPGASKYVVEKVITLQVALELQRLLSPYHTVTMTRATDLYVPLNTRVGLMNGKDMVLCIHANAFSNEAAYGTEVWYPDGASISLAHAIQMGIVERLGTWDRGTKLASKASGTWFYPFNSTAKQRVLVEMAFVTNPQDATKLRDRWREFALAIAKAIEPRVGEEDDVNPEQKALVDRMEALGVTDWAQYKSFVEHLFNLGRVNNPKGVLDDLQGANAHLESVLKKVASDVEPYK